MDFNENNARKGLDLVGTFHQQYYTWSTNAISKNNKVGLGIVASSDQLDGQLQKNIEKLAASCHVCKKENITIEKMVYSRDLATFVALGATPCAAEVDMRENKFVHIYTYMPTQEERVPEEYFADFVYETTWDKEVELPMEFLPDWEESCFSVLEKYQLKDCLPQFFQVVFRSVCGSQKPCYFLSPTKEPKEFLKFSREIMFLVHKILPAELRKEADYVSFAIDDIEEAHFIFKNSTEKSNFFDIETKKMGAQEEDVFLEREFYNSLMELFLSDQLQYEETLDEMSEWLFQLNNSQNCLEKLIWFYFRNDIANGKLGISTSDLINKVDSFIYWAKKDRQLVSVLETVLGIISPDKLNEQEISVYIKHLLLGEQGETRELVYKELDEIASYYFEHDKEIFNNIMAMLEQRNHAIYDALILEYGNKPGRYGEAVLHEEIETPQKLKEIIYNHQRLMANSEYKEFLLKQAYRLYQESEYEKNKKIVRSLGEKIDKKGFQELMKEEAFDGIENVDTLEKLKKHVFSIHSTTLSREISADLYEKDYKLFLSGNQDLRESMLFAEIAEKLSCQEEAKLVLEEKYNQDLIELKRIDELKEYVEKHGRGENALLGPIAFSHLLQICEDFKQLSDFEVDDAVKLATELSDDKDKLAPFLDEKRVRNIEQAIKDSSIEEIVQFPLKEYKEKRVYIALLDRYNELVKEKQNARKLLSMKEAIWINFVMRLVSPFDTKDEKAIKAVQMTKDVLKQNRDLGKLYEVNRILYENGYTTIPCPEIIWNAVRLNEVKIALKLWSVTDTLTLDHIYELLRKKYGDRKAISFLKEELQGDLRGTKKLQAFLRQRGIDYDQHSSNILMEVLYDLLQTYYMSYLFTLFIHLQLLFQKTSRLTESYLLCAGVTIFLVSIYCYEKLASRRKSFQLSQIYFMGVMVAMLSSIVFLLPGPRERTVLLTIMGILAVLNFVGIIIANKPAKKKK
ncbi:MAG: hypothetical protein ACI4F9_01515 [Lachnospiraceae bacterium]